MITRVVILGEPKSGKTSLIDSFGALPISHSTSQLDSYQLNELSNSTIAFFEAHVPEDIQ
jgi:hypothetical protein